VRSSKIRKRFLKKQNLILKRARSGRLEGWIAGSRADFFQSIGQHDQVQPRHMGQEIVAMENARAFFGAALAQREESGKPAPGGAIPRIGENVGGAVGKDEAGAGGKFHSRVLGGLMGAHHAGDGIAISNADSREIEAARPIDQLFRMGSTPQEGEIGGDGKLGIA
jgi:hypothetical protein